MTESLRRAQSEALLDSLTGLKPASRYRVLSAVKSLLAFGHRIGYLPFDVGRVLRLPALRDKLAERILPEADVHRMLSLEPKERNRAILTLLDKGRDGEIYNIGGNRSLPNKTVIEMILAITGKPSSLIEYVTDRPGHDRRYALSSEKLHKETGWAPQMDFERGLAATVDWYRANQDWVRHVKSGEYQNYYSRNYENRRSELGSLA